MHRYLLKHFEQGGEVPLYHFAPKGTAGDTFTTDPGFFGRSPWSASERKAEGTPKTFFYVDLGDKEHFFHDRPLYRASVPSHTIYDATGDEAGHAARAGSVTGLIETLKKLGYKGIFYSGVFPTVAMWEPVTMSKHDEPTKLARMKAPSGGAIVNNVYQKGGQFLAASLKRIRDVVAKLSRSHELEAHDRHTFGPTALPDTHPDEPTRLARKKDGRLPPGAKKLWAWLEANPVIRGVYGLKQFETALKQGRRLTGAEVGEIENTLGVPDKVRLPKDARSNASQRLRWLNWIHDSLNDKAGVGKVLRSKKLPEHYRVAVQQAAKLGYLLHFYPLVREGFPHAPDPLEWYGTSMNPLDVAFHESFAKTPNDPHWGKLNAKKDALESGGRHPWEHAPASTVMRALVGITSPGLQPDQNGIMAHRMIADAIERAKAAGTDQWVDHIQPNQSTYLNEWKHQYGAADPNTTNHDELLSWAAEVASRHPRALAQGAIGYKSAKGDKATGRQFPLPIPLVDSQGRLQPKEWIPHAGSVHTNLARLKKLLAYVRTDPAIAAMKPGPARTTAELSAMSKWILSHHPLSEIKRINDTVKLGFRKPDVAEGGPGVRGGHVFGLKVGEFVPALSGRENYGHQHVQDMHEAWSSRLVHGGLVFKPRTGEYDETQSEKLGDPMRRVLWGGANAALEYLKQHHPDHPALKHPNDTSAVQATQWVGAKLLRDEGGLLDFLAPNPNPLAENKDYVDAANEILAKKRGESAKAKPVFSPTGKRLRLARPEERTHSAMIRTMDAAEPRDFVTRLTFADHLRENGIPGADIVQGHAERVQGGGRSGFIMPGTGEPNMVGHKHDIIVVDDTGRKLGATYEKGNTLKDKVTSDEHREGAPWAQLFGRRNNHNGKLQGGRLVLAVVHRSSGATSASEKGKGSVGHWVEVHGPADLDRYTSDFPEAAREALRAQAKLHWPEEPAKLSRPEDSLHAVYVSPSQREASTFKEAAVALHGPGMQDLIAAASRLPSVTGGQSGIGFWSDGAEEARRVDVGDSRVLTKVAAALGRAFRQKSVLTFEAGPGSDERHVMVVPETDPERIHEAMMRHGIEYKTMIPHPNGTQIEAVDMGGEHRPAFEGFAREAGASSHSVIPGNATFLGDPDREAAVKQYDSLLR